MILNHLIDFFIFYVKCKYSLKNLFKGVIYIYIYIYSNYKMASLEDIRNIKVRSRAAIGTMFLILGGLTGLFYLGSLLI